MAANYSHSKIKQKMKMMTFSQCMPLLVVKKDISYGKYHKIDLEKIPTFDFSPLSTVVTIILEGLFNHNISSLTLRVISIILRPIQ